MAAGILLGAATALGGYLLSRWGAGAALVTRDKTVIAPLPTPKPDVQPLPTSPTTPAAKPSATATPTPTPTPTPAPPVPAPPPPDDDQVLPTPDVAPELPPAPGPVTLEDIAPELPPRPGPVTELELPPIEEEPGPVPDDEEPPPPAPAPPPPDTVSPVPTPIVPPVVPSEIVPEGFDPVAARALARKLAANLASAGRDRYDRSLTRDFQRAAGIDVDGLYGGETRGALLAYGVSSPPAAFFAPTATEPYRWAALLAAQPVTDQAIVYSSRPADEPPPDAPPATLPSAPAAEETPPQPVAAPSEGPPVGFNPETARKLAKQVANNVTNKGHNYARDQLKSFQKAAGIDADGVYGGESRGALIFYGIPRPPAALYKPTETKPYRWADQAGAPA